MGQKSTKKKGGRNKNKRTKKNKKTNKKLSPPRPLTLALRPSHTLEFTSTERQLVDAVNKLIKLLPTLFPKEFFNKRLLPSSAADQLRLMQTVVNNVKSPKFLKGLVATKLLTGQKGGGAFKQFFKSPFVPLLTILLIISPFGRASADKMNNSSVTTYTVGNDLANIPYVVESNSNLPISSEAKFYDDKTSIDSIPIEEGAVVISVYETGLEEAGGSMENIFSFGVENVENVESSTNLTKISTIVTHATQNVGEKLSSLLNPVTNVLRDLLKMNNTVVKAKVAEAKEVAAPVPAPVAAAPVATAPIPELDDDGDFFDADEDPMHTAAEVAPAPAPVELAPVDDAPAFPLVEPVAPVALDAPVAPVAPVALDAPVAPAPAPALVPEPAPAPGTLVAAPKPAATAALAKVVPAPVAVKKVASAPGAAKRKDRSFTRLSGPKLPAPSIKADLLKGLGLGLLAKKIFTKKKPTPKKAIPSRSAYVTAPLTSLESPKKKTASTKKRTASKGTASPKMLTAKRKTAITRKKTPRPLHPLLARKQPSLYVESRKSAQARKLRERKMFGYIRRLTTAEQYKNEKEEERKRRGY